MADRFPTLEVPCAECGTVSKMTGRWALVAERLSDFGEVRLFGRCKICQCILYAPAVDVAMGEVEFFQVVSPPEAEGRLLVERVTYDITALGSLIGGGESSPLIVARDPLNKPSTIVPTSDLNCGICAEPGLLSVQDVTNCLISVAREHPA